MDEGEDHVRASYGADYERLAQIKAAYDPGNLFHVNQNIEPGCHTKAEEKAMNGTTVVLYGYGAHLGYWLLKSYGHAADATGRTGSSRARARVRAASTVRGSRRVSGDQRVGRR